MKKAKVMFLQGMRILMRDKFSLNGFLNLGKSNKKEYSGYKSFNLPKSERKGKTPQEIEKLRQKRYKEVMG